MEENQEMLDPICDGMETPLSEASETAEEEPLARLSREIQELRDLIGGRSKAEDMAALSEFRELYPEVAMEDSPDTVWASVQNGIPPAAAYALYVRREELRRTSAEAVNRKNAGGAWGSADKSGAEEYLSPDEVRGMTRDEVRGNSARIMESMKHWN